MKHQQLHVFALVAAVHFWSSSVLGLVGPDGSCAVIGVMPFTSGGDDHPSSNNLGYSHLAAATLAIKQFNARDPSVVPELEMLTTDICNVTLVNIFNIDSQNGGHHAASVLINALRSAPNGDPCAVVGPHLDLPVSEINVVAQSLSIPVVAYGGIDVAIVDPDVHPFSTRTSGDAVSISLAIATYLVDVHKRTSFVAVLYPLSSIGLQLRESLGIILTTSGVAWTSFGYSTTISIDDDSMLSVAQRIKDTGYRTVVMYSENSLLDIPILARAAEQVGINNDDYFWLFLGSAGIFSSTNEVLAVVEEGLPPAVRKLLRGSAFLDNVESFLVNGNDDPFFKSWRSQNSTFVDEVNQLYPIQDRSEPGYFRADADYFTSSEPAFGAGFLFDAVMAAGFGACHGRRRSNSSTSSGDHLTGIQQSDFHGATGRVRFQNTDLTPGSRQDQGLTFGGLNLGRFQEDQKESLRVTHVLEAASGTWSTRATFYYANNSTEPPDFLRDPPEANYLSPKIRRFSFSLLAIGWGFCFLNAVWIAVNRKHRVLKASQPVFLIHLTLGSAITVSAIFPISFDESHGWTETMLSTACSSMVWLLVVGHIIQYMALFAKMWRINRVFQFRRTEVAVRHVMWPTAVLIGITVVILTVWSVLYGLQWRREIVDDATGESMGSCSGDQSTLWLLCCVPITVLPMLAVGYMAWKTRDIDEAYSDSSWVFTGIMAQLQILFIAVPILVILVDTSTDGRNAGFSVLLFCTSMSLLSLVMFPKYRAFWKALHPEKSRAKRESGTGNVRIQGLNTPPAASEPENGLTSSASMN